MLKKSAAAGLITEPNFDHESADTHLLGGKGIMINSLVSELDHISYAVRSTDEAIRSFSLFYPNIDTYKYSLESQNVLITYLSYKRSNHRIELVEPSESPNPVENVLKEMPSVLYHVCYRVSDFYESIDLLKKSQFLMVTEPFETNIEKDYLACHLFSPDCGLIEIVGRKR